MPLSGGHLGPYEILELLGAGGMGEVYRARDTRLRRDVALKVLPKSFANDAERMARFSREAQILASLSHPNIAAIHGLEEAAGVRALVMELVDGPTLRERIDEGPLPLDMALDIAFRISDALEYAHRKGVIHRDLKPANVKIAREGGVKVLDFGLAKAAGEDTVADGTSLATQTISATRPGMILGTAAYMAPEQARGEPVDGRADIWAFGVVLYEMLSGRRLFEQKTTSDTLAAVLTKEPDWQPIPAQARRLLRSCLQRDSKRRLQSIADAKLLLEDEPGAAPPSHSTSRWQIAAATLGLALIAAAWMLWLGTRSPDRQVMSLHVDLGPDALGGDVVPGSDAPNTIAISPDGTRLAFAARAPDGRTQLATRLLDQPQVTLLPGTDGGGAPFFSPDSKWIGFFAANKMKKVSVYGGAPVTLCEAPDPRGASWGDDGTIVAAPNDSVALWRVSADGGTPQTETGLAKGEITHRFPQVLPGGRAVIFTSHTSFLWYENAAVKALNRRTGQIKTLVHGGYYGRYLPVSDRSGYLVYVHQGVLFGVAFDPDRLELRGLAVPLLEDAAGDPGRASGHFDFSRTGTFIYRSGPAAAQTWPIVWMDSSGRTEPLVAKPGAYFFPRLSPDGKRLAFAADTGKGTDLFVYDWQNEATLRLTYSGLDNLDPSWTRDGRHIVFRSNLEGGGSAIWWTRADGAGEPQRLIESKNLLGVGSLAPGGWLGYFEQSPDTGADILTVPLDLADPDHPRPGTTRPFLRTKSQELYPVFSADGRWIAYMSDESGSMEVWVRPFPGPGGKWQVSSDGGIMPVWSPDGRSLFYQGLDNIIMVAAYTVTGNSFAVAKPRRWCGSPILFAGGVNDLDITPDGKRAVVFPAPGSAASKGSVHLTFILNFPEVVRRKVSAAKN